MNYLFLLSLFAAVQTAAAQKIVRTMSYETGGLTSLTIEGDTTRMDWTVRPDGSQYAWVGPNYSWGLGYMTVAAGREARRYEWNSPADIDLSTGEIVYREGGIRVTVRRRYDGPDLIERYTFTNDRRQSVALSHIGIYTPIADNYPDAPTCIRSRAHAHVWEGDAAAYICCLRMGGFGPHLGLAVTEGEIAAYDQWERGRFKGNSQTRGILALCPPDRDQMNPGESFTVEWRLFAHNGAADFRQKLIKYGSAVVSSPKWVYQQGETAEVWLDTDGSVSQCSARLDGSPLTVRRDANRWTARVPTGSKGEKRVEFVYGKSRKRTHADLLVIGSERSLIDTRARFIASRQRMTDKSDPRYGALMVYDCEGDSIYPNRTPNCNPVDRDEGAERVGMGVLLAICCLVDKDKTLLPLLTDYAHFLRHGLQTDDYTTYSSVDKTNRIRAYNYVWIAQYYFLMARITADKQYARDAYNTLRAMYSRFGHGFYAIGVPVRLGLETLRKFKMETEYAGLLSDFRQTGDTFIANGLNYPKSEVNYEQSIVAPAVATLLQLYLATSEQKYFDEARRQLPVVEAFGGFQPSYHKNEIAIRHWDGHWFGKRELFGDTFPHYWSTVSAAVYHYWAEATGDATYQSRAEEIVRNNLCLFFADGRASCAYLYPRTIDGLPAAFYDAYANDQDWALVYYYLVNREL